MAIGLRWNRYIMSIPFFLLVTHDILFIHVGGKGQKAFAKGGASVKKTIQL